MPTDKPRITITIPDDQFSKVQDFQYGNKMKNQTQAILALIEMGFEELQKKEASTAKEFAMNAPPLSTEDRVRNLALQAGLVSDSKDLRKEDLDFLLHLVQAAQAYFKKSKQ